MHVLSLSLGKHFYTPVSTVQGLVNGILAKTKSRRQATPHKGH